MAWMNFTYAATHGDHQWAEADGRALIEDGEIVEIELQSLSRGGFFTVADALERDIALFLRTDSYYRDRIAEITEDDHGGRIVADRETTLKLRREAA